MKRIIVLLFYCSIVLLFGCQNKQLYKDNRIMLGTFVEVTSPDKRAANIVFSEIRRIEDLFSIYKPDSEVSKLNKLGELKVSPDTFYIIKKAKEFWRSSDGAFDITVGPLMELWGFMEKKYSVPEKKQIEKTLNLVGSDKIILNNTNNMIKFAVLGMKIDLGAIAKGYALDCAVRKLKERGIKSCLINAGGQVYGLGDKPRTFGPFEFIFNKKVRGKFGKPWSIAIKDPRGKDFIGYLELKNKSVATSGDYEQYFIKDNLRYTHILNPKTGHPADSGIISVTVIAPDGLIADVLSTAIFVLGKEKGAALVKKFPDVKLKIIEKKNVSYNR